MALRLTGAGLRPTRLFLSRLLAAAALWAVAGPAPAPDFCPPPDLREMPPGDAASDAADGVQLFESIDLAGITDRQESTAGVVLADFNGDRLTDILAIHDTSRTLRLHLNQGCFRFTEHPIRILDSGLTADDIGRSANIPNVVDFNGDGFLDIFLSRGRGGNPDSPSPGNTLLLSQGAFDTFVDRAEALGISNVGAYNRQSSIADVNGDGWLDIAVAADNIGNTRPGLPVHRLYVYQPADSGVFEEGTFKDIGGTDTVPGFGGEFACDADVDRGGPGVTLRDMDGDGDTDLIQTYHADMNGARWDEACTSGEYHQGVYTWRNLLADTGEFRFERVTDNGLAEQGRMRYDEVLGYYVPEQNAVGLPYVNVADVDNDGLPDVIAVGPTDPEFHVNSDPIVARFWRNQGGFTFVESTEEAGLGPLNWTYREWEAFWDADMPSTSLLETILCEASNQKPLCESLAAEDHQIYGADALFGDFDNDGYLDLLVADRHEVDGAFGTLRNLLFMNRGDGTFEPVETELSGIDSNSIAVEAADINGDGLLDLVFGADPANTYPDRLYPDLPPLPGDRLTDKVYWNTGAFGGDDNHWLRVSLAGVPDRLAVGARISVYTGEYGTPERRLVGMRQLHSNHSYKSGNALEAHFGLGDLRKVDVKVVLPNGTERLFTDVTADQFIALNLGS